MVSFNRVEVVPDLVSQSFHLAQLGHQLDDNRLLLLGSLGRLFDTSLKERHHWVIDFDEVPLLVVIDEYGHILLLNGVSD
jgi:hypothetical protein